jgi:hypothetical protein
MTAATTMLRHKSANAQAQHVSFGPRIMNPSTTTLNRDSRRAELKTE